MWFISCPAIYMCNNEMGYISQIGMLCNQMNKSHGIENRNFNFNFLKNVHECRIGLNNIKELLFKIFFFFALNDMSAFLVQRGACTFKLSSDTYILQYNLHF